MSPDDLAKAPPLAAGYDMAVADSSGKSVALVRYIYADKGDVEEIFTEYLQQKINKI